MRGHQLGKALAPAFGEVVLLGFRNENKRKAKDILAEFRAAGDDVIRDAGKPRVRGYGNGFVAPERVIRDKGFAGFPQQRKNHGFTAGGFRTENIKVSPAELKVLKKCV